MLTRMPAPRHAELARALSRQRHAASILPLTHRDDERCTSLTAVREYIVYCSILAFCAVSCRSVHHFPVSFLHIPCPSTLSFCTGCISLLRLRSGAWLHVSHKALPNDASDAQGYVLAEPQAAAHDGELEECQWTAAGNSDVEWDGDGCRELAAAASASDAHNADDA